MPIVNDPSHFGRIAATNAISDERRIDEPRVARDAVRDAPRVVVEQVAKTIS